VFVQGYIGPHHDGSAETFGVQQGDAVLRQIDGRDPRRYLLAAVQCHARLVAAGLLQQALDNPVIGGNTTTAKEYRGLFGDLGAHLITDLDLLEVLNIGVGSQGLQMALSVLEGDLARPVIDGADDSRSGFNLGTH
jgi:hypothetical protein